MRKFVNGSYLDLTEEEQLQQRNAQILEKTRPLTESELSRLFLKQNIQTILPDDADASRAVGFHPQMQYDGTLITAGTRINWNGSLKRAAVDLWDREENDPEHAPALWEGIFYREGYRLIPQVITATQAFAEGECGWWEGSLYRSKISANVYTPTAYPAGWEAVTYDK